MFLFCENHSLSLSPNSLPTPNPVTSMNSLKVSPMSFSMCVESGQSDTNSGDLLTAGSRGGAVCTALRPHLPQVLRPSPRPRDPSPPHPGVLHS